jgi:carboxyl-terminal processing protease
MRAFMNIPRLAVISMLVIGLAVLCSGCFSSKPSQSSATSVKVPDGLEPLVEVWDDLHEQFYGQDQLKTEVLLEASIRGMLAALDDPYTAYFPKEEYTISTSDLGGSFEGIGAQVTDRDGQIVIIRPLTGSPAEKSGIRAQDVVLSVDGESLKGLTLLEAILKIRGPKGDPVVLRVLHAGDSTPVDITVVRDTIVNASVDYRIIEPGVGYLRILSFDSPTPEDMRVALEDLVNDGMEGLILDLRSNGGGLRSAAITISSQFIPDGLVMYSIDASGAREDFPVQPEGVATSVPMVLLVNGFSASASEIVAGALKDHDRATIVGTRTLGKGSVTRLQPLSNGAGINVTIARFFTPNGTVIEGVGIEPDIVVDIGLGRVSDFRLRSAVLDLCNTYEENVGDIDTDPIYVNVILELCSLPPNVVDGGGATDIQFDVALEELKDKLVGARK